MPCAMLSLSKSSSALRVDLGSLASEVADPFLEVSFETGCEYELESSLHRS